MSRLLISIGLIAATVLGGCTPPTKPAPPPPQMGPAGGREIESSTALAGTAASYAQSMQQTLVRRSAGKIEPPEAPEPHPPALPPLILPEVKWLEPELRLTEAQEPAWPRPAPPSETAVERVALVDPIPVAPAQVGAPPREIASDALEAKLARRVKENPKDLAAQVDYQLILMLRGRDVPQMDVVAGLAAEDREIVLALADALRNFRANAADDGNALLARKVAPLTELSNRLRSRAELRIPNIALCSRVDGFGVYEPMNAERFTAGQSHEMVVYCEVENFLSQLNERNLWETHLTQEAVIYNDHGQRVWDEKQRPVVDTSRNRRQDFYVARLVKLPPTLTAGKYTLKMTITDRNASRITEASVGFTVVRR